MTNINLTMNKWHLQDKMPYIYLGESGENNVVVLNVEVDDLITSTNDTKVTYFVDIYNQDNLQVANTQPFDIIDNKLVAKLTKGFLTVNGIKKLQIRCVVTDNDYNELQTYLSNQIHASVGQGNFGTTYNTDLVDVDTSCKLIIEIFEKFQELFDITNDLKDDIAQQESDLNNLDGIAQKFENIDDGDVDTLLDVRYIYFVTNSLHLPTNGKYLVMPLGNTSVCYGQCAINCETQAIYFRNNEIENDVITWHEWVSSNDAQEQEIQQIKDDVQTLSNNVDDLHTNIKDLDNSVDDLQDNFSQLQSNVSGLNSNVQTLNNSVDSLNGDVQTLQNDVSGLNDNIQTLDGNISDIQDDINNIWKTQGKLGAKNLLTYPYLMTTKTNNGVTITDNGDGTLTVNGTAKTTIFFNLCNIDFGEVVIGSENSEYIMSDGVDHSLNLEIGYNPRNKITSLNIWQGAILDNVTVYPMVRYKSDTDSTWQPYAKTNRELTKNVDVINDILDKPVINKNYLSYPYYSDAGKNNGITYNSAKEGSVSVNGTAIGYSVYFLIKQDKLTLPKGKYLLSAKFPSDTPTCVEVQCYQYDSTLKKNTLWKSLNVNEQIVICDIDNEKAELGIRIAVNASNIPINNITIENIMFQRLEGSYADFEPYTPSVAELKATIEQLKADNEIVDISNSFYSSLSEGIIIESTETHVFKQGKHVWGDLVLSGLKDNTSDDQTIMYLKYFPKYTINSFFINAKYRYDANITLGCMFLTTNGQTIIKKVSANDKTIAKIHLDYTTT